MPQVILEYSNNIIEKNNLKLLFSAIHEILTMNLPTEMGSCKSRAIELKEFYIGDGNPKNALIHMRIQVLKGRSGETLSKVSKIILQELTRYFSESKQSLNLQISLEMTELSEFYYKI